MLSLPLRTLAVAICATLMPMARAQSPAAETKPVYSVQGVVLNSLTHQPIPRALVESNSAATLTDSEGHFELSLPEGIAAISVRRPGYNVRGQDSNHAVNVTASTPDLTFTLTPEAAITGHVTLSTGEPASGITFMAYLRTLFEGHERWITANSVATDSEGTFRMSNLETPGLWVVCSAPQEDRDGIRAARSHAPAIVGYPSTCFPGPIPVSAERAPANALTLAPGEQADLDIALTRQPFYRVAIAAPSETGTGTGTGTVDFEIHDLTGRILGFSPEWNFQKGQAEVYLPSGQYYAVANFAAGESFRYGRVDFRVGAKPLTGIIVTPLPLHPIPVEIHKDFTATAQSGERSEFMKAFASQANSPGLNLTFISAEATIGVVSGGALNRRPGSSSFQLSNVLPGRYWVRAYPYEGYVASITSGATDLTRQPLEVGPANSALPVEITLRNDSGQIACTVVRPQSDDPASGANGGEMNVSWVYAIPTSQTVSQIPQGQGILQKQEPITIPNLAPGTYRIVAFDQYQQIDLNNPQQLAEIASRGQTVTVTPSGTASVQVELIHASSASPNEDAESGAQD